MDPSDPQQASFRFQFTGQERDLMNAGTLDDLDYMHARSYSSHMGRFLQVDPVLGSVGNPQSWNRYAYVLGNPTNLTDPTGAKWIRDHVTVCDYWGNCTTDYHFTWEPDPGPPGSCWLDPASCFVNLPIGRLPGEEPPNRGITGEPPNGDPGGGGGSPPGNGNDGGQSSDETKPCNIVDRALNFILPVSLDYTAGDQLGGAASAILQRNGDVSVLVGVGLAFGAVGQGASGGPAANTKNGGNPKAPNGLGIWGTGGAGGFFGFATDGWFPIFPFGKQGGSLFGTASLATGAGAAAGVLVGLRFTLKGLLPPVKKCR